MNQCESKRTCKQTFALPIRCQRLASQVPLFTNERSSICGYPGKVVVPMPVNLLNRLNIHTQTHMCSGSRPRSQRRSPHRQIDKTDSTKENTPPSAQAITQ